MIDLDQIAALLKYDGIDDSKTSKSHSHSHSKDKDDNLWDFEFDSFYAMTRKNSDLNSIRYDFAYESHLKIKPKNLPTVAPTPSPGLNISSLPFLYYPSMGIGWMISDYSR